MTIKDDKLREQILKAMGKGSPSITPSPILNVGKIGKTESKSLAMRMVEARFGLRLEEVLSSSRKGIDLAKELGVSEACVSKWRRSLGIVIKPRKADKELE